MHDNDNPDNISLKNPNYSELTALYAMWKNCDADIQGLYHYRRYITSIDILQEECSLSVTNNYQAMNGILIHSHEVKETSISEQSIIEGLKSSDVICRTPVDSYPLNTLDFFLRVCYFKDIKELCNLIRDEYPDYFPHIINLLKHYTYSSCNMFIARRNFIDSYCTWLFEVLEKMERRTSMNGYSVQRKRLYGYLSEILLNVYVMKHNLRCKYFYSSFVKEKDKLSLKVLLKRIPGFVNFVRAVRRRQDRNFYRESKYFNITITRLTHKSSVITFIPVNSDIIYTCGLSSLLNSVKADIHDMENEFAGRKIKIFPRIALRSETPESIKQAFIESGVSVIEYD